MVMKKVRRAESPPYQIANVAKQLIGRAFSPKLLEFPPGAMPQATMHSKCAFQHSGRGKAIRSRHQGARDARLHRRMASVIDHEQLRLRPRAV